MKNLNFFEKLWEHGRTLRRVGLVLVMCLIAIPQMWARVYSNEEILYVKNIKPGGWKDAWKTSSGVMWAVFSGETDTKVVGQKLNGTDNAEGTIYAFQVPNGTHTTVTLYRGSSTSNEWNHTNAITLDASKNYISAGYNANASTATWSTINMFEKDKYLYLLPTSNWKSNSAKFEMYFYDGVHSEWVSMTQEGSTDYWYGKVPSRNWPYVIFVRMNPSGTAHDWNSKWNKTQDLTPTSGRNYCKVTDNNGWNDGSFQSSPHVTTLSASSIEDNGSTLYGGDGTTSGTAYLIEKNTSLKVKASATKVVADPDAAIYYKIIDISATKQEKTTPTCSFNAYSSADHIHQMKVDAYAKISSTKGTALTSSIVYYKTVTCYTVTYDDNDATSGSIPAVSGSKYVSGSNVTLATNTGSLDKSGYSFNGWNDDPDGDGTHYDAGGTLEGISGNVTLYAEWSATPSLTVNAGTHVGTVTGSNPAVTLGNSYAISASNFDAGYEFNNWTASPVGNASFASSTSASTNVTVSNGSVTVTANAREKMTTVTINANPAGAGTFTVDASAFTPGNTTTAGVATSRTVVATPTSGKVFHDWTVTGNATGSASTNTYTLEGNGNAGTGTLTANFGIASGWYMEGTDFGGWNRGTAQYQLTYPYREMDGVVYYPTTLTKDHYWKVNNGTTPYSINSTSSPAIVKGTIYPIAEEWSYSTYASSTMNNVWVVVDKGTNKKLWVQDPQTFHNVNVTGVDNDKGPVKVTLKTTSAFTKGDNVFETTQFANGETFTVTVTPVTGYIPTITIGGNTPVTWWKEQATYTADGTMSTSDITVTISYTPTRAVRFAKTTGCSNLSATGPSSTSVSDNTKIKDGTEITFHQENSTGYTFSKWYSNNTGTSGIKYSDEDDDYTLTVSSSAYTIYPIYTANTYTVDFDVNGGTASKPDNKEVTFGSAYGELPGGMTHASKTFIGWYTNPDDGEGTHITAETIVNTASDHILYAHYENVYSVNVNFKCGSDVIYPSTSVNASPTSLTPEITAPEILGYTFSNWTGTNVTPASSTSATTTITATASTTITANYTAVPTVYFKNNLGWENVYVTFDAYFGEAGGATVPGQNGKPYYKMTQLGSTDVYYCVIPDAVNDSWKWNIAFDNKGFTYNEDTHIGSYGYFYQGEFLGRGDFDPKATMFIPYSEDYETRNSGKCYTTGCWMKYNSTDPGYNIYANTYVEGEGSAVAGTPVLLTADVAGGFEFKAKVNFPSADYTYGFMLGKEHEKNTNDLWYSNGGTIWSTTNTLPWDFSAKVDGNAVTSTGKRCGLKTEATGDYTFIVSFATGKPMVNVIYPVSTGDYRLVYKDLATWSNGAHTAAWQHPSRVIKANANAEDIVSFYVSKADGANASIKLQKCTSIDGSGNPVWNAGTAVDLSGITKTGIYNFKVTQDADKNATVTFDGGYTGNFYIRTDASDGGWSNYKTSGKNTMTYSEYAESQTADKRFSHYFMRHVNNGQNIKFCIANDYSECISDTLVDDTYASEWIGNEANIRFMWYHATNKISRAYLSGSTIVSDRFLVLEGDDKMFDANGDALNISGLNANEINFTDDQNWIYEATVKAKPGARIKLTAKFADRIQYFYGAEGARSDATTDVLIGGSGSDKYKMRIVYDFKTNRLMRAFIPDATITTDLAINADLMIIREHQEQAQQISFSGEGALSDVKTVYGAMKFNKYTVNGKAKTGGHEATGASRYERDLFYISFPFDVKLGDVFGFGEYGKHWIIEYYDGKGRAKNGFWADSEPNWKFVWPAQRSSFTMKAFEGYILALELDEMAESSSIWDNGVENVYVYFPSDGNVNNISATNRTITIDQEGYECKINRATPDGNRTVKDSYWHCIGVPSFANYSRPLSPTSGGETIDWSDDDGEIDWSTPNLPYLYVWNRVDNSLSVTTSATFDFKATWSYLVQYAGTSIYWSQVNVTPASIVARERTAPTNAEFRIELQQGGEKTDQTFVRLTEEENVTTGFDFNYDLSKEYNKNRANIYTMVTTVKEGDASVTQSAANVLPMSDQTTVVPVGVKIATTGDYTFAIPEGTAGVGVTLIDNETGIRTSLSALDYTINLSAGTYENRFVLEISPIKQMPTDIESVSDQHSAVRKVMIDGILYIVKDGKVFDARGAKVK